MPPFAALSLVLLATPPDCGKDCPAIELPAVVAEDEVDEDSRKPEQPKRLDLDELARRRAATDIAEALSELPGVVARRRWNEAQDSQVQVRGFGARTPFGVRGLRIEYDGVPATAADGQSQLGHIDIASGGRMRFISGPFAALYGNGGGYLRVETRGAQRAGERVALAGGSHGQWRAGFAAETGEDLRLGVAASHFRSDGVRARSAAERTLASARLDFELGADDSFALSAHWQDQPEAQDPQGLTRAEFGSDPFGANPLAAQFQTRKSSRQVQLGTRWLRAFEGGELSLSAYAGARSIGQVLAVSVQAQQRPGSGGGIVDLERDYHGASLRWLRRASFAAGEAEFSAELREERLDEDRRGYENFVGDRLGVRGALRRDESTRGLSRDALLRADFDPSEGLRLSAGVRRARARYASKDRYIVPGNPDDSGRYTQSAWLPVAGFSYRLDRHWRAHAAAGRTQELPTLAELAFRADGDGGFNAALRPARGRQAEAGLVYAGDALHAGLTLFRVEMDDEIVVDSAVGGRTSFRNAGATRRDGAEFAFDWRLAADWQLRGVANWIDARYSEGYGNCALPACAPPVIAVPAGRKLPGVPARSARFELGWNPREDWSAALEWQARSATPASDRNDDRVPGHAEWNLRVHKRLPVQDFGRASLLLRVENLLDRRYSDSLVVNDGNRRYFETAPGRGYWLGLDLTF